jgi:hypothetical protein
MKEVLGEGKWREKQIKDERVTVSMSTIMRCHESEMALSPDQFSSRSEKA